MNDLELAAVERVGRGLAGLLENYTFLQDRKVSRPPPDMLTPRVVEKLVFEATRDCSHMLDPILRVLRINDELSYFDWVERCAI